jgi:UDP-N-acetylglucosamine/UDP-N-acetylgalactosamine diphosphorylase
MLNQNPIFLGGQGGLVGPVSLEYGVVIAAGTIARKDITKENSMLLGNPSVPKRIPFHPDIYSNVKRIIRQNSIYIANLIALRAWYLSVRSVFFKRDGIQDALLNGALAKIESAINERIKRLGEVALKVSESIEPYKSTEKKPSQLSIERKRELVDRWPEMKDLFSDSFEESGDSGNRDKFLKIIENTISENGKDYLTVIRRLKKEEAETGTLWLQSIVNNICGRIWTLLPGMGLK